MIKYYYKSITGTELTEIDEPRKGTWIYVEAPTDVEVAQLAKQFQLEPGNLEDARDDDEMPRLERQDGQTYIYVRFAYRNSQGDLSTMPLLIVFGGEYVVTVSRIRLPALDHLMRGQTPFATTQRSKLVLLILSQISDQYDGFINRISRQIKSIRSRLRSTGITNKDLLDFVTIEDDLNEFQASLQPTNAALRRLLVGKQLPLFDDDHDIVEDLLLNNEQSIEAIRSNLLSVSNIRDAYSAISSNNLNRTITLLTLATILVALPNVFFGMYGMNVELPFQHSPWAFGVLITINVVLITSIVAFVRKKRII
ncbi:MAG: magnesium transporter CorA family protein [Patescibacteria group bacterium]|nr:magnesium transporter CorA family protein [Patescibacteria group bacterium]